MPVRCPYCAGLLPSSFLRTPYLCQQYVEPEGGQALALAGSSSMVTWPRIALQLICMGLALPCHQLKTTCGAGSGEGMVMGKGRGGRRLFVRVGSSGVGRGTIAQPPQDNGR